MIALHGLTKRYGGRPAVDDVTLDVPAGSICGLLGRNGAGKTTTFRCMLQFTRPDAGEVLFDGAPLTAATFLKLAYVPERPALYSWLSVGQHLELARRSQPAFDAQRTSELMATFRLDPRKRAGKLSKGQQTALALTIALCGNPSILLLDEPASGLDPVLQRAVLDLLIDAAASGATILLSSHQIGQVERAADRIAIMRDGRLVVSGDLDDVRASAKIVEATFLEAIPALDALPGIERVERIGTSVRVYSNGDAAHIAAWFNAAGARGVRVLDRTLEDLFLEAVDEKGGS